MSDLAIGARIGDYELLEERERHAAGALFTARYIPYQSRLFLEAVHTGPESISRNDLVACLQAAARVRSPHVCGIIEWFRRGQTVFIAMEFAPGSTLAALLDEACELPFEQAMEILEACAGAAGAAQGAGIYYLALDPRNLVLTSAGPVKLLRAGYHHLLESQDELLRRESLLYRAPEALGGSPGRVSDVYSMGVLLRSLLPAADAAGLGPLLSAATGSAGGRPGMRLLLERCLEEAPAGSPAGAAAPALSENGRERAALTAADAGEHRAGLPGAATRHLLVLLLILAAAFLLAKTAGGCRSSAPPPGGRAVITTVVPPAPT